MGYPDNSHYRGKDCGLLNFGDGSQTAHCLRWTDLWYSAYEIANYEYYYAITLSITNQNTGVTREFTVDTAVPIVKDDLSGILMRVVGDYMPVSPPPVLSHLRLLIPTRPSTHVLAKEVSHIYIYI